jgi:hypothetical protein
MVMLTPKEAAELLADRLGWPLQAADVESAAKRGRMRAEKGPGRHDYLIPEEEVLRIIQENERDNPVNRARAAELEAAVWDALPRRPWDLFFRVSWKRRSREPGCPPETPRVPGDDVAEGIRRDLERLEARGKRKPK